MVLDQISQKLEKRRAELVGMLDNKHTLELEKQHQIYGAINEIDLFLQTLSYHANNKSESEIGHITLIKPVEEESDVFSRFFKGIKDKVSKNK